MLILEANELEQEKLVDAALLADGPIGTATEDPYGVVLWPAGQVVAQAIAARDLQGRELLELGAGTSSYLSSGQATASLEHRRGAKPTSTMTCLVLFESFRGGA